MNSRTSSFASLTVAFAMATARLATAAAPPAEVFDGVDNVTMPGVVGSLVVFGPDAFVAAAGESEGVKLPFIAAGPCVQGRIVACGHNGFISPETLKHKSSGKLMSNLMLWAAQTKPQQASKLRVGVVDDRGLAEALQKAGLQVSPLSGPNWSRNLKGLQLLIASPRKLSVEQVAPILKFVQDGGGLVLGDAGWVWEGYNAQPGETLNRDFVGNQIGRHAGLMWSSRNVESPESKEVAVSAELASELTAHGAIEHLRKLPARSGTGSDAKQAVVTLQAAISLLPLDDTLLRPELEALLKERRPELAIPRPRDPVKESDIFAWLQVANETRKVLDTPVDQLQPHPMADVFPSQPPQAARGVKQTIAVNTAQPRWHSTGLYARSGDKIAIKLPPSAAGKGLSVRIGPHKDRLWEKDKWQRAPEVSREFPLAKASTTVGSGFGGLIYVEVPDDCPLGRIDVEIDGGIPAPLYMHGETSQAEWLKARVLPGPWAELASSKFIITLPSEAIRKLERPNELMDFWDRVLDKCADLATTPHERKSPERFVIDAQISAGYMHAGYPIMAPLNLAEEVTDLSTLQRTGNWGVYHEIGHNHQEPEWTWDGLTEVTVNLFSMYVLEQINPGAPLHDAIQPHKLAEMTAKFEQSGKLEGPWPQLMPYIQLRREFGWEPFQKVFAEYQSVPEKDRPKTTQARKDEWLVRFSQAVGKDLGPFYEYWKIGMSPEARQKVNGLPKWMPEKFR